MEKSITVTAAGKINLSLRVTGQRHDGYHTIDTVMHETGLHDTITVTLGGEGITVDCPGDIEPQSNLAYRAACAYLDACGAETGVHIAIEKHIPVSGGMAGGSADAAAVLRGLDSLIGTVSKERLYGAALSLGADVPFCLAGGAMRCTGIGEIMTPCRPLPPHKLMIVGGCGEKRSTAAMYSELDSRLGRGADGCGGKSRIDIGGDMVQALESGLLDRICAALHNDFELVNLGCAEVRRLLANCGALGSLLCGSGPTVFGLFEPAFDTAPAVDRPTAAGYRVLYVGI